MASTPDLEANTFGEEDRRYNGSRFSDVVAALFANPYQRVWGGTSEPPLPLQTMNLRTVFGALVSFGPNQFFRASERTLDSRADLRWGPDGKGVRRLVHPNGVCLIGRWQITEYLRNPVAVAFWRRVVANYTQGRYQERVTNGEVRQVFESGISRAQKPA